MDFTNKLIYIYDTQNGIWQFQTIPIEEEKEIIQVSKILYSVTEIVFLWNNQ